MKQKTEKQTRSLRDRRDAPLATRSDLSSSRKDGHCGRDERNIGRRLRALSKNEEFSLAHVARTFAITICCSTSMPIKSLP